MGNELKAAFFDVDWTLYDHKAKRYVPSGIAAINELKHKGVKVFICSARPYESLRLFGAFDQGVKWDGFIACAGAYAVVGGKAIRKLSMPKGQVRTLVNLANRHGLVIQLVTPRTRFLTAARNEYVDSFRPRGIRRRVHIRLARDQRLPLRQARRRHLRRRTRQRRGHRRCLIPSRHSKRTIDRLRRRRPRRFHEGSGGDFRLHGQRQARGQRAGRLRHQPDR